MSDPLSILIYVDQFLEKMKISLILIIFIFKALKVNKS